MLGIVDQRLSASIRVNAAREVVRRIDDQRGNPPIGLLDPFELADPLIHQAGPPIKRIDDSLQQARQTVAQRPSAVLRCCQLAGPAIDIVIDLEAIRLRLRPAAIAVEPQRVGRAAGALVVTGRRVQRAIGEAALPASAPHGSPSSS